jgi:hypothetical protein
MLRSVVLVVLIATPALAAPPGETVPVVEPPLPDPYWPHYGLIFEAGLTTGLAVGGQLRLDRLGIRASAGYNPVVIAVTDDETFKLEEVHVFSSLQVNADVFALPLEGARGVHLGLVGGYKYNSLLGNGFSVGVEAQIRRTRHFGYHILFGVGIFPDGSERVSEKRDLPADADYNFPFGAGVQSGATFGVTYHP